MKRILRLTAFAALLFAGACARHKIISDDELSKIFRDAFLANAYVSLESVSLDSLNIYEPIFARYGYTTADVQYTIGNFSKRKSARLGDVVERAIELLEAEGKFLNKEVSVLDTIDNVARRSFTRTVYSDSLIRIRSPRDTARLRFSVDVQPGEYTLELQYLVDSLDRNGLNLRNSVWIERNDGSKINQYTTSLRRERSENLSRRFTVDTSMRRLWVKLLEYRERPERTSVTIRDLRVRYTPPTEQAVDSLFAKQLPIRIFADEFFRAAIPADSL